MGTVLVLDVLVKATILLLMATFADMAFRRMSAAVRHQLWSVTFIALLLLPVMTFQLPEWRISIHPFYGPSQIAKTDPVEVKAARSFVTCEEAVEKIPLARSVSVDAIRPLSIDENIRLSSESAGEDKGGTLHRSVEAARRQSARPWLSPSSFSSVAVFVWLFGSVGAVLPLCLGLRANAKFRKDSKPFCNSELSDLFSQLCRRIQIEGSIELRQSPQSIVPMTWGIWKPVVLVPKEFATWSMDCCRMVLLHELAHVKRMDVFFHLLARVACAFYWFHPLVWYALRRLRIERELACDDCVLALNERPSAYAMQLLEVARRFQNSVFPPAVTMAHRSGLEVRIHALLDSARSHLPISPLFGRTLAIVSIASAALLAIVRLETVARLSAASLSAAISQDSSTQLRDNLDINGRILDPSGKPLAGARVLAIREFEARSIDKQTLELVQETKSDQDGRFRLSVAPSSERFSDGTHLESQKLVIAALMSGFGSRYHSLRESENDLDLTLSKASLPIQGRFVDLEGKPITDAFVSVCKVESADANSDKEILYHANFLELPDAQTTNDGSFRLEPLGDDRLVTLRIESRDFCTVYLQVRTRSMPETESAISDPRFGTSKVYGNEFVYSLEPSQIIRGTLKDRESGEPIVGASVVLNRFKNNWMQFEDFIVSKTDGNGHYELRGVPSATLSSRGTNQLMVLPPTDEPYFRAEFVVPKTSNLEPIEFDISLTKGIWLTGQVTDMESGKPVRGMVAYSPFRSNPNRAAQSAFSYQLSTGFVGLVATDSQGNFRIPGLRGRGVIRVDAAREWEYKVYPPLPLDGEQRPSLQELSESHIMSGNGMQEIEVGEIDEFPSVEMKLARYESVPIRIKDKDGNDVSQCMVAGRFPRSRPTPSGHRVPYWDTGRQSSSSVEVFVPERIPVTAMDQPVIVYHPGLELSATVELTDLMKSETKEVILKPCVKIMGRLRKGDEPLPSGATVNSGIGLMNETRISSMSRSGKMGAASNHIQVQYPFYDQWQIGEEGVFQITVPAANDITVIVSLQEKQIIIADKLNAEPGEFIDLGDINISNRRSKWPKPIRKGANEK